MDVAAIVSLAFVASITPGPNNVMLWASGLNHGVRRTLPHLAGVNVGFALLIFTVAAGRGTFLARYSAAQTAIKLVGGAYLLFLAYRIFNTSGVRRADAGDRPMTFLQAALFQWVNPKAWVIATTAASTGLSQTSPLVSAALSLTAVFAIVNLPCISAWMLSGTFSSRLLDNERRVRNMNRALGVLLAATVALIVS